MHIVYFSSLWQSRDKIAALESWEMAAFMSKIQRRYAPMFRDTLFWVAQNLPELLQWNKDDFIDDYIDQVQTFAQLGEDGYTDVTLKPRKWLEMQNEHTKKRLGELDGHPDKVKILSRILRKVEVSARIPLEEAAVAEEEWRKHTLQGKDMLMKALNGLKGELKFEYFADWEGFRNKLKDEKVKADQQAALNFAKKLAKHPGGLSVNPPD